MQSGTPDEIRRHPRSPYVAALLGVNLLAGQLTGDGRFVLDGGGELQVAAAGPARRSAVIDPTAVSLFAAEPHGQHAQLLAGGRSATSTRPPTGSACTSRRRFALVADVTPAAAAELALVPGVEVWCAVKATAIQVHAALSHGAATGRVDNVAAMTDMGAEPRSTSSSTCCATPTHLRRRRPRR